MTEPTRVVGLTVVYRSAGEEVRALDEVTLAFPAGQIIVVAGPSGSGKSTLLRVLAGFDRPTAGAVHVGGHDLGSMGERGRRGLRRRLLAVIHQRSLANLVAELTAEQHVVFARRVRRAADRPTDPLAEFGLGDHRRARPAQLSGGEQQRLATAMGLAGDVEVILADEPTAELDRASAARVIEALQRLAAAGRTVVVASHDPDMAAVADTIVRLSDGRVVP